MTTLLSVYNAHVAGDLTFEQMAQAFDRDVTALKAELTRRGAAFPAFLATMDALQAQAITRDQAATNLGVSVRNINKLMLAWGVKRNLGENIVTAISAEIKWKVHYRFACDFIAGRLNLEKAAEAAEVTDRQMRRIVIALLQKHFNMEWKALATLTFTQSQQLAREIMTAEAINADVQRVTDAISSGKMDRLDYSLRLIAAKRAEKAAERAARRQAKIEEERAKQAAAKVAARKTMSSLAAANSAARSAAAKAAQATKAAKTPKPRKTP